MSKKIVFPLIFLALLCVIVFFRPGVNLFLVSFNKISINDAKQLATDCQIKALAETHDRNYAIGLVNGSDKFLDDKFVVSNHYKKYDKNYNEFFDLIKSSKYRCGFVVQEMIE